MDDYLAKPIKLKELREALDRLIGPRRAWTTTVVPGEVEVPLEAPLSSLPASETIAIDIVVPVVQVRVAPKRVPTTTRLLVAEDNPVNQKLIVRLLEKLGLPADVVGNGAEAVEAFSFRSYSAVLMDCQMPEMDGFEATAAIRLQNQQDGMRTPIIAVTAHAMKGDRERCLAAGMDDYITKPIRPEILKKVLDQWLAQTPAPSASAPALPLPKPSFNLQAALERVEGDRDLLNEMATLFLAEYPRFVQQLHQAIAENDPATVSYAAHTLKGSVGNFVDEETAAAAFLLEKMGREGALAQAPDALAQLESALARLTPALAKLTTELAA
jgi:CheY-like chemotaxis protein